MKISAIGNCNFRGIAFDKKSTKTAKPVQTTSPVKAIPVALLIAMSPLNAPVINAQNSTFQTEQNISELELVSQDYYKNEDPKGYSCRIDVYKTRDKEKYVELHLAKKIDSYAIDSVGNFVDAYRLKEIVINPEELYSHIETRNYVSGGKTISIRYYVTGSGTEYTGVPQACGTNDILKDTQPIISRVENKQYEIPSDAYKQVKKLLKDKVSINEGKSTTLVIQGRK